MGGDSRADELARVPLFAGLSKKDRELIAASLDEFDFASGQVLIREGDSNHAFFVLRDGEAEVFVGGEHRRMLGHGDFFGEISMERRVPATATVVARSPIRAYVMSHAQFRSLQGNEATLARLRAAIAERLASTPH